MKNLNWKRRKVIGEGKGGKYLEKGYIFCGGEENREEKGGKYHG